LIDRTALRDVLAEFWSDLWYGGTARRIHAQKPLVRRPAIITQRAQWAAEIEAKRMKA